MENQKKVKSKISKCNSDLFLIVVLLVFIPTFYIHRLFPQEIGPFVYRIISNLTPITFLAIWFITCTHWYYPFIALPTLMFLCRLCSVIINGRVIVDDHWMYLPLVALLLFYPIYRWRQQRQRIEPQDYHKPTMHREVLIWLWRALRAEDKSFQLRKTLREIFIQNVSDLEDRETQKQPHTLGDHFVLTVLLLSTVLPYAYLLFPQTESFLFIRSEYFRNIRVLMHHFFQKFDLILLLFIWFVSCRQWWWYFIAWPLLMYCFQVVSLLGIEMGFIEADKAFYLVPLALVLIYPLYQARKFLYWDIFHEEWEKDHLHREKVVKYVICSLTSFVFLSLTIYLIQKLLFEYPFASENSQKSDPVVFQWLFVLLLLGWYLSAKDWWFFLLPFPLLYCLFNAMASMGLPGTMGVDQVELYYLLPVLLLVLHPLYRLRYYLFKQLYKDKEKDPYKTLRRERQGDILHKLRHLLQQPLSAINKSDLCISGILLTFVPFFYTYRLFSEKEGIFFIYHITSKLAPCVLLAIWFVSCTGQYYRYIAIPLLIFFCQLCSMIVNAELLIEDHWMYLPWAVLLLYPICKWRQWRQQLEFQNYHEPTIHQEAWTLLSAIWQGGVFLQAWKGLRGSLAPSIAQSKNQRTKGYYLILAVLLLSGPWSYAYLLFPDTKSFLFIQSEHLKNVQQLMYYFFHKSGLILLLFAWFVSCRQWWWYVIAWPLLMYCFQVISLICIEAGWVSVDKLFYLILLALVLAYPLYRVRKFMYWNIIIKGERKTISLMDRS